jgi:hypothetical protein
MRKEFLIQIKYSIGYPFFELGGTDMKQQMYAQFARENDGKRAKICLDDDISYDMRKFFEGAVAPYFFFQSEVAYNSIPEAREALKMEFGKKIYQKNIKGATLIVPISTAKYNKAEFQTLLDNILAYFQENGFIYPDSEDFRKWRDSSPLIGEIYPPLKLLIESFEKRTGRKVGK